MRKTLLCILILTLFVASCAPGDRERGFRDRDGEGDLEAYTGTKGIELYLEQPQKIITFPGETLTFPVRVANEGRFDTDVTLYVSGFDEGLMRYTQKEQTMSLAGKRSAGAGQAIPGETQIIYFSTDPVSLVGTSLPQNTIVTACFEYETELTYGVCVDRNANAKCDLTASPEAGALGSGQGAPVAVSSITATARGPISDKTIVTYIIKFAQADTTNGAKVVKKDKLQQACKGEKLNEIVDFNKIHIDEVKLGADIELDCVTADGVIDLRYGGTLTCNAEINYQSTDYSSGLYIKASYGFLKSVTQPIEIQSLVR
jgi:hypothetical protein